MLQSELDLSLHSRRHPGRLGRRGQPWHDCCGRLDGLHVHWPFCHCNKFCKPNNLAFKSSTNIDHLGRVLSRLFTSSLPINNVNSFPHGNRPFCRFNPGCCLCSGRIWGLVLLQATAAKTGIAADTVCGHGSCSRQHRRAAPRATWWDGTKRTYG